LNGSAAALASITTMTGYGHWNGVSPRLVSVTPELTFCSGTIADGSQLPVLLTKEVMAGMAAENAVRLAVLIDADNAQPAITEALLAEVAKYGTAHVKRAYGDWTGTSLKGWKDHLLAQSIQPIQQFAYTTGKNATDAAMVIDAMDLLYVDRTTGRHAGES
jgi:hypothetical protein